MKSRPLLNAWMSHCSDQTQLGKSLVPPQSANANEHSMAIATTEAETRTVD